MDIESVPIITTILVTNNKSVWLNGNNQNEEVCCKPSESSERIM